MKISHANFSTQKIQYLAPENVLGMSLLKKKIGRSAIHSLKTFHSDDIALQKHLASLICSLMVYNSKFYSILQPNDNQSET